MVSSAKPLSFAVGGTPCSSSSPSAAGRCSPSRRTSQRSDALAAANGGSQPQTDSDAGTGPGVIQRKIKIKKIIIIRIIHTSRNIDTTTKVFIRVVNRSFKILHRSTVVVTLTCL